MSVDVATADGAGGWAGTAPAAAGADYTATSSVLIFPPGRTVHSVSVSILDDQCPFPKRAPNRRLHRDRELLADGLERRELLAGRGFERLDKRLAVVGEHRHGAARTGELDVEGVESGRGRPPGPSFAASRLWTRTHSGFCLLR